MGSKAAGSTCRHVHYGFALEIAAPRATVWKALTEETAAWWPPDFRMVAGSQGALLEARAGGRLYEQGANGAELLWYTVSLVTPPEALHLVGHVAPPWGGPATSLLQLALAEAQGGRATTLRVDDYLFGHVADAHVASLETGWNQLFGDGLRPFAERARVRKRP